MGGAEDVFGLTTFVCSSETYDRASSLREMTRHGIVVETDEEITEQHHYLRVQREAAEKLTACLDDEDFDPWNYFNAFYGSYSAAFDTMALTTLRNIEAMDRTGETLSNEMFREYLCSLELCEYGSSPRVCFATPDFALLLPRLIEQWKAHAEKVWKMSF